MTSYKLYGIYGDKAFLSRRFRDFCVKIYGRGSRIAWIDDRNDDVLKIYGLVFGVIAD